MFRFKRFAIQQDRTAMKVCTDACVLGAYADVGAGGRVLDIGTGTGLLALMVAQRNPTARIDAVEVDEAAFGQAVENVAATGAGNFRAAARIRVVRARIQDFWPEGRYDRIITNPPFYTNHLPSPDAAVNRALHTGELPFEELLTAVSRLLKPDGQWWVLLPPYEADRLAALAAELGLWPFQRLYLRHNAQKPVFRVITGFSAQQDSPLAGKLAVYEVGGQTHTPEFRALLRDFYLIF